MGKPLSSTEESAKKTTEKSVPPQRPTAKPGTIAYAVQAENFKRHFLCSSSAEDNFNRFFPTLSADRQVDSQVERCFIKESDLQDDPDLQELLEVAPEASAFIDREQSAVEETPSPVPRSRSYVPTTFSHQRYLKHVTKRPGGIKKSQYIDRKEMGRRIAVLFQRLAELERLEKTELEEKRNDEGEEDDGDHGNLESN